MSLENVLVSIMMSVCVYIWVLRGMLKYSKWLAYTNNCICILEKKAIQRHVLSVLYTMFFYVFQCSIVVCYWFLILKKFWVGFGVLSMSVSHFVQ